MTWGSNRKTENTCLKIPLQEAASPDEGAGRGRLQIQGNAFTAGLASPADLQVLVPGPGLAASAGSPRRTQHGEEVVYDEVKSPERGVEVCSSHKATVHPEGMNGSLLGCSWL